MRVAFFTPVSPQKSGISDYAEQEILPYLSKLCDIDIFIDKNVKPSNKDLINNFNIYPYTEFPQREKNYDISLYHMGNNSLHEFIFKTLVQYPGIVVLHDIFLHGFLWNISLSKGDYKNYIDTFAYCYGEKGIKIAQTAVTTGVFPEFEYPLIKKIIDCSLGVICHSEYGITHVVKENCESIVKKINQPYSVKDHEKGPDFQIAIKSELELKKSFPIITSFGFIFSHKRYHVILKAFKRFLEIYPDAKLILVGEDMMNLNRMIAGLGLTKSIIQTGYVSHLQAQQYLDISDFCINLRYPTAGETSRSVLQIMASKKPVIVSDVGWFAEIPDDACLKVDVNNCEEENLLQYMIVLSSNPELKRAIGENARNYIIKEHEPDKIAHDYYSFMKSILEGNEYAINEISGRLNDLNIGEEDVLIIRHTLDKIKEILQ